MSKVFGHLNITPLVTVKHLIPKLQPEPLICSIDSSEIRLKGVGWGLRSELWMKKVCGRTFLRFKVHFYHIGGFSCSIQNQSWRIICSVLQFELIDRVGSISTVQ